MVDFAPYYVRAGLTLPDAWVAWAGAALTGEARLPQAAPDFPQVENSLAKHGLLPLLYDRLRNNPIWPELPTCMRSSLSAAFHTNAARSFLLEAELGRIAGECPGLTLLKGMAVGATVYANLALRPVSDMDLLVEPDQVAHVQARLARLGYAGVGMAADARFGRLARRYRAELPLVAAVPGLGRLLVELHWSLAELPHYVELITASALLEGACPAATIPGYLVPRPAVLLAYAAGHLALHHSRDLRLIWLVDLDRLVRAGSVDWDDLLRLAEGWKLGLALHAGLLAVNRWLGTPVDAGVLQELDRPARDKIAIRSWGLGDEVPDRAWRRASTALAALPPRQALNYAGWLLMRALLRPAERHLLAIRERAR